MREPMIPSSYAGKGWTKQDCLLSVGPGWAKIVIRLFDRIIELNNSGASISIAQIKEKFGGLRFYVDGELIESLRDEIDKAEEESFTVCEWCGKPGELRTGRWMKTLCEEHSNEFNK